MADEEEHALERIRLPSWSLGSTISLFPVIEGSKMTSRAVSCVTVLVEAWIGSEDVSSLTYRRYTFQLRTSNVASEECIVLSGDADGWHKNIDLRR